MKVLMLTDYFSPHSGGGVERVVLELSRALMRRGVEVAIITLNTRMAPAYEVLTEMQVYRVKAVPVTRILGLQGAVSARLYARALEVAQGFRPDLLHTHNIFFMTSVVAPLIARRLRLPLVTTMHLGSLTTLPGLRSWAPRLYQATVGRWILRSSDLVTAVSERVREHGLALGVPEHRIVTVPNAVDISYEQSPAGGSAGGTRSVVFVGRLIFNKGPHLFVEAAERVLSLVADVEFHLVGDGPMRRRLEEDVRRKGLHRHVRFWGFREDIRDVLGGATLFARPSLLEGLPLAVLEAMACGVPVIASRVAGVTELVRHGETGLLVDPGDTRALADAMVMLLTDEPQRQSLAANARTAVKPYTGWDAIADRVFAVYDALLRVTRGSRPVADGLADTLSTSS